jgi:hypothetical protein
MKVKAEGLPPVQGPEHRDKIYSRAAGRTLRVHDARAEIERASRRSHRERDEISVFLESKREMIRSHARLTSAEKARALAEIDQAVAAAESSDGSPEPAAEGDSGGGDGADDDPPVPGGVGFGVFYDTAYKLDFDSATAAEFLILCPARAGGNLKNWLYLTSMNRASLGAEALVAYEGQEEFRFLVFDWARTDHWQVDLPFYALTAYLHDISVYGATHQALHVVNFTFSSAEGTWTNEVYLQKPSTGDLDLIYAHDYTSTSEEQKAGWTGSWGPILETFQNLYRDTNELGFALFHLASRRVMEWDGWELLSPEDTYVRQDGTGFRMVHLDPNHTFVARA